jgi:hypothetical protein
VRLRSSLLSRSPSEPRRAFGPMWTLPVAPIGRADAEDHSGLQRAAAPLNIATPAAVEDHVGARRSRAKRARPLGRARR